MTTTIDEDSVISDATQIDDTDSPYTTSGEDTIQVDTSSDAVTVTLASADTTSGREVRIVDTGLNAGTNNITINTEGSETINPGANSSISVAINGGYEDLWTDGSNWYSSRSRDTVTLANIIAQSIGNGGSPVPFSDNIDVNGNALEDTNQSYVDFANNIGASSDRVNIFASDVNTSTVTDPDTSTAYDVNNDLNRSDVDDDTKIFFGSDNDYSLRYDSTNDEWTLRDEINATDLINLPKNTDISQILESGGAYELNVGSLSGDLADEQDPKPHATEHENGGVDEINVGGLSGDLADAQDPKTHSSTHSQGNSDEVIVENLGATSTDTTQAFKPDGSGGVTVGSVSGSNIPNWQVDGNSPFNPSSVTDPTYTMSSTYDTVMIIIDYAESDGGGGDIRVNGDSTSNYDYIDQGDTETTGQTEISLGAFNNFNAYNKIVFRDGGSGGIYMNFEYTADGTGATVSGRWFGGSGPLSQFTVLGSSLTLKANVYGLNI